MHIFLNASRTLIVQPPLYVHITPLPILLRGEEEEEEQVVVEWASSRFRASPRSGRLRFNGLARPARVSENLALYSLPRLAGYFSGAELALSLTGLQGRTSTLRAGGFFFPVHFEALY
ncbi:hypothetical protein PBY51_011044 [Eleginops maclovinus]|uniref:Uncharacterized protein n=1 Tax=Eleginops maclovinus TaxID=56733 RepID=A0AAN7X926_ELEMC|nr:hypothetical protein PBY51_011044 [Eleginops maclovinus]